MRILFIHEVNYLKKPVFEMHEFPEHLAARGHDVFFLHFPEGASRAELSGLAWAQEMAGRAVPNVRITLLTPKLRFSGLVGRVLVAIGGYWVVKAAIRTAKPDLVVTLAVPTYGWQAVSATCRAEVPLVYRALDVSHLIRGGVFRSLVRRAETFVVKNANFVSANNEAMADYIQELASRAEGVEVHFPPMDLETFRAGDRGSGRMRMGLSASDHVIMYMGSFFYFSGLPEAIQVFSKFSPDPSTKFVLVGGGELDNELRSLVHELGLENQILFTGFVEFDVLPDYLAAADVLINPMKKSLVSDTALPNKIIQYLAASRPIVTTDLKGAHLTFKGYTGLQLVESPEECVRRAIGILTDETEVDFNSNFQMLDETFGFSAILRFETYLRRAAVSS